MLGRDTPVIPAEGFLFMITYQIILGKDPQTPLLLGEGSPKPPHVASQIKIQLRARIGSPEGTCGGPCKCVVVLGPAEASNTGGTPPRPPDQGKKYSASLVLSNLDVIGGGAYGGEPKVPLPYERQAPSGAVMEYVRALEWALTMTRGDC